MDKISIVEHLMLEAGCSIPAIRYVCNSLDEKDYVVVPHKMVYFTFRVPWRRKER